MSKFNVGDTVKYIGLDHAEHSDFYPLYDTIGEIKEVCDDHCWVQWPKGSTSDDDYWSCEKINLELIETNKNEMIQNMNDMTNEEIWKMLESKMRKNGLKPCGSRLLLTNGIANVYAWEDVHNAIALAYKAGYLRSQKGRPFKFGEKKKKGGHWEPVDPNNLPKEGTKVRYSRENIDWANSTYVEIGDTGTVQFWKGYFGFNLDVSKGIDWICILTQADCLDMWVEDDE